ncbi:MAG TPA: bifunctional riboflavin kinase/FAD synthetase [Planctomycetaceae bacterium]|nr:bifunctional riboflavin kinase/FAD synthetase [Planctomycetaceae bacterium]
MQIVRQIDDFHPFRGGVVSIGNFDGVHLGHRAMLRKLVSLAKRRGVMATAMTFDPPPVALIAPERVPPRLSTVKRKAELMESLGIDCLLVYPTSREFLSLSAQDFFEQIIRQQLKALGLVEGPNFFFGKGRQGDVKLLAELAASQQMDFEVVSAVEQEGMVISSSLIRQMISQGRIEEAVHWLGHPYRLTGTVETGASRGSGLGFPTANLTDIHTLMPRNGVYAGVTEIEGRPYPAALNIGANPTFADNNFKLEAHLIGYQGDLYGQELSVDLLSFVRDIQKFEDAAQLKSQLEKDVSAIQAIVSSRIVQ